MATRILLIDDDELLRVAISDLLESEGYAVATAQDGDEGLAAFQAERPDLVITDIMMPGKDGIETIMSLTKEQPPPRIIAISGGGGHLDSLSYLRMAQELGADRILEKPFRAKVLLDTIDDVLAGKPAPRNEDAAN